MSAAEKTVEEFRAFLEQERKLRKSPEGRAPPAAEEQAEEADETVQISRKSLRLLLAMAYTSRDTLAAYFGCNRELGRLKSRASDAWEIARAEAATPADKARSKRLNEAVKLLTGNMFSLKVRSEQIYDRYLAHREPVQAALVAGGEASGWTGVEPLHHPLLEFEPAAKRARRA